MTVSHRGAEVTSVPLKMLGFTVMRRNKQKSTEPVMAQVTVLITLLLAGGEAWWALTGIPAFTPSWLPVADGPVGCWILGKGKQSSRGTTVVSPTSLEWDFPVTWLPWNCHL